MFDPSKKAAPIRVLLVEDDEDDYVLTRDMLEQSGVDVFLLEWVSSLEEAIESLKRHEHDAYLVDYHLGPDNGIDLLPVAQELGCTAPIIMLTGQEESEIDLTAMRLGATDYLVKNQVAAPLLSRSIRYAIEQKRTEKRLLEMAQSDSLTGLVNRAMFYELLDRAILRANRSQKALALLFIDLDRFKSINDTFGHHIGDLLLQTVADRLRACLRSVDTIARLGGDEFVVIAEEIETPEDACVVAQTIVDRIEPAYLLEEHKIMLSASIGIATYPNGNDDSKAILKNADTAMYRAKNLGRNRYQFHDAEADSQSAA